VPTLTAGGVELAYREQGTGPAVVLVHGLASDAEAWAPVADALGGRARVVSYDRRGYGGSSAPTPYVRTTVVEQAQDAAGLMDALGASPAVVCGEDLGALVCLDLLVRLPELVRAAVLVDVPLFAFVPSATEALGAERIALEEAMRSGGPEAAVRGWLGDGVDPSRRDRAAAHAVAFFADYAGLTSWPVTRRELRAIAAPVGIVDTPAVRPHVREAGDRLAELVPGARRRADGDVVAALEEMLAAGVSS
jgi:pimeloyl-ACP methyl ester carboxylesterase